MLEFLWARGDARRSELQALAEWLKLDKLKIKRTFKGH
jgi:hypothetical protein